MKPIFVDQRGADIAFQGTGYHLVTFSGGRYILSGKVAQHTQYAIEMPNNFLKNILYPIHPRSSGHDSYHNKTIGEIVVYSDSAVTIGSQQPVSRSRFSQFIFIVSSL